MIYNRSRSNSGFCRSSGRRLWNFLKVTLCWNQDNTEGCGGERLSLRALLTLLAASRKIYDKLTRLNFSLAETIVSYLGYRMNSSQCSGNKKISRVRGTVELAWDKATHWVSLEGSLSFILSAPLPP